ncbi:MAG TPA: phosphate ABC transporter permease PstA, partial [Candidatus Methylacidiphilales bacterium]
MTSMPPGKFQHRPTLATRIEALWMWLFRGVTYFVLLCALGIFGTIVVKGAPVLFKPDFPFVNVAFLTQKPETLHVLGEGDGSEMKLGDTEYRARLAKGENLPPEKENFVYSAGGIFPCIVGTVLLVVGSMTIALFLGVCSAIYLSEYSKRGPVIAAIRLAILNLSGVPSIVFGLFGYSLFCITFGWGTSILAGWFTLAFMVLPVVITASEESLQSVPKGFREGSLALGATKWQTIWNNVLPYALPGILTSSILGVARVAGETAPIMFTAAFVIRDELPWQVKHAMDFFFQGVMALPYHIYVVSSKVPPNAYTERVEYGTAFVFLFVVVGISMSAVWLRI